MTIITFFIAYGEIPKILLPTVNDLISFLTIIFTFILSLIFHEISHIIVLINHDVKEISLKLSMRGILGFFVKADVDSKKCEEVIPFFYSIGLGSNLLLFLIFLPFFEINPYLHIISIVNFWLLFINGIPAPLLDGGRIFEILLKKLKIEKNIELISISLLIIWLLLLILRIYT